MVLCYFTRLRKRKPQHCFNRSRWGLFVLPLAPPLAVLMAITTAVVVLLVTSRTETRLEHSSFQPSEFPEQGQNEPTFVWVQSQQESKAEEILETRKSRPQYYPPVEPSETRTSDVKAHGLPEFRHDLPSRGGPYHDWELFAADYQEMLRDLKIFVYPDVSNNASTFASIFLPHPNPYDPKLGNYFSEHAFKVSLLHSPLVTQRPEEAHFFFMPFSINAMRNDPRLRSHSEASISDFVAQYTHRISSQYNFWNASEGADHFYAYCHSVGREAAAKHPGLHNNAIQVTCSSSYFQRLYVAHKDIGMPQVWPRQEEEVLNPRDARNRLVFFAGRMQNSRTRRQLQALWGNDTTMDIFSWNPSFRYEEGFRRSRYCLHVKGYEVNTARVCDAIHYGCIPVLLSNYYDLPLANVLDWSKFSLIINEADIADLKNILLSVSKQMYTSLYQNLCIVRKHFSWHSIPRNYDSFYMTAYQLWLKRGIHRLSY